MLHSGASGETTLMRIEGPTPMALTLAGWSDAALAVGERVVVVASPSRDPDSTLVLGNSILKEGGGYLPMGGTRLREALAAGPEQ